MGTMIGDRSTSDVVARLRTPDGRDEWIYCHAHILIQKSKYFADRLSESWPTCQILDYRNCVEVYCQEHDFDHYITVLRLFYVTTRCSVTNTCHGVKNTLGILQVAVDLGCPEIISTCADFLEASPWEEAEEEEILKVIPSMGLIAEPILRRLQPVNQTTIVKIFLSATMFATSELSPTMVDLKTSAQEQIEYMLTEDAPLLTADEDIKSKVRQYFKGLLSRFTNTVKSACETGDMYKFQSFLVDMSWACQILAKLELLKNFVENWMDASENLVKAIDNISQSQQVDTLETKLKVIEITSKVLEAIAYGRVILPTVKRLHMVRYWLPFVKSLKSSIDSLTTDENDYLVVKIDGEIWQSLESSFVSIILALPSGEQAKILSEWLANKHI